MEERIYWNENNGLGVALTNEYVSLLVNVDAELYGIPNPDQHAMMECTLSIAQHSSLAPLVSRLENEPERHRSSTIEEISKVIWPDWYDPLD